MRKLQRSQTTRKTVTMSFRIPVDLAHRLDRVFPPTNHAGQSMIKTRNLEIVRLLYRMVEDKESAK